MQKFYLFDLIEKLLPLEKTLKNLNEVAKNESKSPAEKAENTPPPKPKTKGISTYYLLVKKHDEISKRIDENSNLKTPKS